jgi:hypothetical protein
LTPSSRPNEGGDALIHLRVPAATKARWVRESRAAGQRLTDWIIHRVEAPVQTTIPTSIPAGLNFADLHLARDADGAVSMDWTPIRAICRASGLPEDFFERQPEDALAGMLTHWYRLHLAAGGAPDPVQEDLIAEARAEDDRGGGLSHAPGRA